MNMTQTLEQLTGSPLAACSDRQIYLALLELVRTKAGERREPVRGRKLYYISAEFLIGKLLSNNLINLGLYDQVRTALADAGKNLADIEEVEPEPSLGNGGLGRLAACFLDSLATLDLPGDGIGLRYHCGLFRQDLQGGFQAEKPDPWLSEHSWAERTEITYPVSLAGRTYQARLYRLAVTGYGGRTNTLNLFDLDTVDESIIREGIAFDKTDIAKNLTLFLYPDDSDVAGRRLRIYQQYLMVSAGAQLLLDECVARGSDLHDLADYAAVQINDTHPSMVIPELIRLLGERGIEFEEACRIVTDVCAYTNHTILAEALEKWPAASLERVVPQLMPILRALDQRAKRHSSDPATAIWDGEDLIHMAHLDIHYSSKVNGVAELHTEILKNTELRPFYRLYPEKFTNKTNGITFRRWLMGCNEPLSALITEAIGPDWQRDAGRLEDLLERQGDAAFLERLRAVKGENKRTLARWLRERQGVIVDPESVLDIQIKRLHQYKRQQMNALYAIWKYLRIKEGHTPPRPVTMVFGAKAAPAYTLAKDTIHLLLCLSRIIRSDPQVSPWLNLVMVENYNVTAAEHLVPACDVSEQISLASKEASGTGNMKLMANGAVTLGTLDGANVEISRLVGEGNLYLFGRSADEVISLYQTGGYRSSDYWQKPEVGELVDFLLSPHMLAVGDVESLTRLYKDFLAKDYFMALLDLEDYIAVKEKCLTDYEDRPAWSEKMLVNIARSGFFSSDRTIAEYNRDIWHL